MVLALQKAVRAPGRDAWLKYLDLAEESRPAMELRDLLDLNAIGEPVEVDSVEAVELIMNRFVTAAMSLGALSPEAQ